jgi:hypothetical protein
MKKLLLLFPALALSAALQAQSPNASNSGPTNPFGISMGSPTTAADDRPHAMRLPTTGPKDTLKTAEDTLRKALNARLVVGHDDIKRAWKSGKKIRLAKEVFAQCETYVKDPRYQTTHLAQKIKDILEGHEEQLKALPLSKNSTEELALVKTTFLLLQAIVDPNFINPRQMRTGRWIWGEWPRSY